jgi:predicted nucleotidyltransferase
VEARKGINRTATLVTPEWRLNREAYRTQEEKGEMNEEARLASTPATVHYGRMVKRSQIRAYSEAVVREFHPHKIVLFGSYAYGTPTEDSDVDLLVIMPFERKRGRKSLEIRRRVPADFPMDLIVRTPEFIAQRLEWGDCFTHEILSKGKVLYEATDARMGRKGRG